MEIDNDRPLTVSVLNGLNVAQLHMMMNDLYDHIDRSNEELVNLLLERDSLSMEQDSVLVDIEDLTK